MSLGWQSVDILCTPTRYLAYLTITLHNDEIYGIFKNVPSDGSLKNMQASSPECRCRPSWEKDTQWKDILQSLPCDMKRTKCHLHPPGECPADASLARIFDIQFQFFLWLVRPYITMLSNKAEKEKAEIWVQRLSQLSYRPKECLELKGLRNDYMQALIGYVHELELLGPFKEFPSCGPLPPLTEVANECPTPENFQDPTSVTANQFLSQQPVPENGAFAYITLSGSSLNL